MDADIENFFPGFTTVNGFVKSTVPTGSPCRSFGSNKNDIGITWINYDITNLARLF